MILSKTFFKILTIIKNGFLQTAANALIFISRCDKITILSRAARRDCDIYRRGDIAQLVERLNGIQKVRGSIPLISTNKTQIVIIGLGLFFYDLVIFVYGGCLNGNA